ncbi:N-acetyltransferase [Thiomicrospira microaerophila]|uniref:GNAT family N-acetyltransferase n=1 Tax=Thiomicrospira microaerophila TaxID=406020 RepID=UPI0020107F1D|nr:GNAT family N-acetyltransferase [Thiomicrospira microaerophila]UQB43095.1 N-acetyltransferase [Thiomicrospira microaerophila]
MELHLVRQIAEIDRQAWNSLVADNHPFLRHEFLQALEDHQCVSAKFGWYPQHLALYHHGRLIAAMPLYAKTNSYGEFVFDHSWAQAWQSVGLSYFPKWVTSVPYAPVTGPRFLIASEQDADHIRTLLVQHLQKLAIEQQVSGWHILFADTLDQAWLNQQDDWLIRHDCHFHWYNRGYQSFDDFLADLKPKKRKNIKQERRKVVDAGVNLVRLNGYTASDQDWQDFNRFYQKTFAEKHSLATLNRGFFQAVAKALPDQVLLVMAQRDGKNIAGSLMFHSDSTLFGRHWGCVEEINSLHFEACYYQGIEFALEQGLKRFEPGAGGEHKIARGFEPVISQSAHWMTPHPFDEGLAAFLQQEKAMIDDYFYQSCLQSPFSSPRE